MQAAVPAAFHAWPGERTPLNRLGVAEWLVDARNPLTARVLANRLWACLFGVGLVASEEDFGTQGTYPMHRELLDWVALTLVDNGWDVKALLRLIVTSPTYKQTTRAPAATRARDPRNDLLARGPRFRLEAEAIRDQALAISGLLSNKMHGPSVYPPQPDGLWQPAFNGQRTCSSRVASRRRTVAGTGVCDRPGTMANPRDRETTSRSNRTRAGRPAGMCVVSIP